MAAALSGATMGQLRSWRQDRGHGPFLVPELQARPKALYSFRDVLALRAFAHLRQEFSLQAIRRAVDTLRKLGEVDHLAAYSLVADDGSIVLCRDDEYPTDLLKKPGQRVIATLADILQPFTPRPGVVVPHLLHPYPHVSVDPDTQGGHSVISGTRVPYDSVAELLQDGVPADEIADYYPSVGAQAARDAEVFARYVDSYGPSSRAARCGSSSTRTVP